MEETEYRRLALLELPAVYRLAYHLWSCPHEVEDLVQETYLHALKAAGQFKLQDYGIRPWLFKILHNVVNARFAKQMREEKLRESLRESAASSDYSGGAGVSPLASIVWDEVDQRLKSAIDELPFAYKVVFLLSAVDGLRYREIAQVVNAPIGTVMSRLHRARVMLASRLQDLACERGLRAHDLPKDEMNTSK